MQKPDFEVQANNISIESAQEKLKGINTNIRSLEERMRKHKDEDEKRVQEQETLVDNCKKIKEVYRKLRK